MVGRRGYESDFKRREKQQTQFNRTSKVIPQKYEEHNPQTVNSLPAIYKYSWDLFAEPSYVDRIDMDRIEPQEAASSLTVCKQIETLLTDPRATVQNGHTVKEGNFVIEEKISKDSEVTLKPVNQQRYSTILANLNTKSDQIVAERNIIQSPEAQHKFRQVQLLLVALMRSTSGSTVVYKDGGTNVTQQGMYKKIHLIGDSRVREIFSRESWPTMSMERPHLHCKDDLSLFTLMDFLIKVVPKVSVKGNMLVICCVGIRDVVRVIDEQGVLVTLETILKEMKQIRKKFRVHYGPEHDLLFSDILPADISHMMKLTKEDVGVQEGELYASEITVKLIKFTYLLAKNMMSEDLSRIKHLPPWEIFMNPLSFLLKDSEINIPSLKDGLNPEMSSFPSMGKRMSRICSAYYTLKDPPPYNKDLYELCFVCNERYSVMEKFWPAQAIMEKPRFIFLESVSTETIVTSLEHEFPLKKYSILVIWFDVMDFFCTSILDDCENHSAVKLNLPHFQCPQQIFDELIISRKKLEQASGTPNVVFTTFCPFDYKEHFEKIITDHKIHDHVLELPSATTLNQINTYLLDVIDKVNLYIIQSNRVRGIPGWDLCGHLYKRDKDGFLAFQLPVSPSDTGAVRPQTVARIMMAVAEFSQPTINSIMWTNYVSTTDVVDTYELRDSKENLDAAQNNKSVSVTKKRSRSRSRSRSAPRFCRTKTSPRRSDSVRFSRGSSHRISPKRDHPRRRSSPQAYSRAPRRRDNAPVSDTHHSSSNRPPVYEPTRGDASSVHHYRATPTLLAPPPPPIHAYTQLETPMTPASRPYALPPSVLPSTSFTGDTMTIEAPRPPTPSCAQNPISDAALKGKDEESDESVEEDDGTASIEAVEKIVSSLKKAHDKEVLGIREHPESHPSYDSQHSEFIVQAIKFARASGEAANLASIDRVWKAYFSMQLEQTFVKTWEKRVAHLTAVLSKDKPLPLVIRAFIAKAIRMPAAVHNDALLTKFTSSETNLLNKIKKAKGQGVTSKVTVTVSSKQSEKFIGVALGEKMLAQVKRSWKTIGCEKSNAMLDKAINKITEFMQKQDISTEEKSCYVNLAVKLQNFKLYITTKEKNPYDLDYKSIAEITKTFATSEVEEYVISVTQAKEINNPASEDIAMVIDQIKQIQQRTHFTDGFVKGGVQYQ